MSLVKTDRSGPPAALDSEQDGPGSATRPEPQGPRGDPQPESTELYSWRQFHDRLREAAIQSAMIARPFALLVVEVRDLGRRGDAFGRSLIRLFADRVGARGSVARYGENILIAVLPHTQLEEAAAVVDSFRSAVAALGESDRIDPADLTSVAVCGYDPDEPLSQLLERAFERLRAAARAPDRAAPDTIDRTDATAPSDATAAGGSGSHALNEEDG
jgi:GGDEF domain-containing protein